MIENDCSENVPVQCGDCGISLNELPDSLERRPCHKCGSTRRAFTIFVEDTVALREQIGVKVKDPHLTGSKKIKIEQIIGDDLHRKTGKWFKKVRVIDRENNRYFEKITDPDTGEVIHQCDEPLSEHLGHGSAKKSIQSPGDTPPPLTN